MITDEALSGDSFAESRVESRAMPLHPKLAISQRSWRWAANHQGRFKTVRWPNAEVAASAEVLRSNPMLFARRIHVFGTDSSGRTREREASARLALTPPLRRDTLRMTQANNAGIKRNRRPAGAKVVERKIVLAAETEARLKAAGMASGSLSLSLYLELLVGQLESQYGTLPVLSPTLEGTEAHAKKVT